ncbi:4Fe-4S dicluster domain-containing protein [Pseudomonas sp. LRF_L74]|uniref:4Fe-4S dicluster domain-containing protein n=1 Tax=Pseudomonas sp. LRF_L74 TaxID=3369422 RepID=UPI003F5F19C2
MIEVIVDDICIGCMACVRACPNDVFSADESRKLAVIERQEDCCTCYLCEAYCPVDCLFVAPQAYPQAVDLQALLASGQLGSFRRALGWDKRSPGSTRHHQPLDQTRLLSGADAPGGPGANHRTASYAIGEVNESHRHSRFDPLAAGLLAAQEASR